MEGARGIPDIAVPGLAAAVLAQIEQHPETYDQSEWHSSCDARHCAAGWCVRLAGEAAQAVEAYLGTSLAARLALGLPLTSEAPFGRHDDPLPWLRELAAEEAER